MDQPPPNGTDKRLALLEYQIAELTKVVERVRQGQVHQLALWLTMAGSIIAVFVAVVIK